VCSFPLLQLLLRSCFHPRKEVCQLFRPQCALSAHGVHYHHEQLRHTHSRRTHHLESRCSELAVRQNGNIVSGASVACYLHSMLMYLLVSMGLLKVRL